MKDLNIAETDMVLVWNTSRSYGEMRNMADSKRVTKHDEHYAGLMPPPTSTAVTHALLLPSPTAGRGRGSGGSGMSNVGGAWGLAQRMW